MVEYQTLSIVLTGIGMIIALTYYALQIRNQNRTRQATLFMQLYHQSIESPDFMKDWMLFNSIQWNSYQEYQEKVVAIPENLDAALRVGGFLEGVSVLVREDLISIRLVSFLV